MTDPAPPLTSTARKPMSIKYMDTTSAYDRWASVYDTDGNFLQAMDSIEMKSLLSRFVSSISSPRPWKIVDLGCGTGRNSAVLLGLDATRLVAIDASSKMLDVARERMSTAGQWGEKVHFEVFDLIKSTTPLAVAINADGIVSTLVLEHIPVDIFFSHVSTMLKPGGVLLLTNMHSHMGSISQAGFIDPTTGEKVRPTSYAHTVEEVVAAAKACRLEPIGKIEERAVDESMVEQLGIRSQKWVGITCWFGGLFRKIA